MRNWITINFKKIEGKVLCKLIFLIYPSGGEILNPKMVLPIIIPLLSKAKRGLSMASSIITETYLSIGDSFSDSDFKDLKRSSVKP